jgi:hypothetical protein
MGHRGGSATTEAAAGATYLTDAWFAWARERTAGTLPPRPGIDARLQYDVRSADRRWRWFQVIEDGQLRDWALGELPDAEVEIRWDLETALAVLRQEIGGSEALAATTIAAPAAGGVYVGPPPPANLGFQRSLAALPHFPGATVAIQVHLWSGPFGEVAYFVSFVDGQLQAQGFGVLPQPDIVVELPYLEYMRYERGDITVLELIAMGRLEAAEGPLVTYAGLLESPPFEEAMRACGPSGVALGSLGEVATTPAYRVALAEIASQTAAP